MKDCWSCNEQYNQNEFCDPLESNILLPLRWPEPEKQQYQQKELQSKQNDSESFRCKQQSSFILYPQFQTWKLIECNQQFKRKMFCWETGKTELSKTEANQIWREPRQKCNGLSLIWYPNHFKTVRECPKTH